MDPLSLTASLFAVLAATKASLRKIADYQDAKQELGSLMSELDRVQNVVQNVSAYVTVDANAPEVEDLISSVKYLLVKVEVIRSIISPTSHVQNFSTSTQQRITWLRKKRTLVNLRDELRIIRSDLVLQLSIVGTYVNDIISNLTIDS